MQLDTTATTTGQVPNLATDSVAIVSGGLDSTTLVYDMLLNGYRPHLLSFNYGQRHMKELTFAAATAKKLHLPHDVIDLTGLTHLISNSALTSAPAHEKCSCYTSPMTFEGPQRDCAVHGEFSVPEGHYAEDNMKLTVVPNRNMIMLSIAAGVAVNEKARCIGIGVHAGDHFVYPDCRPMFIDTMNVAVNVANEGFDNFEATNAIYAPFLHKSKADIAYRALELNVPLHATWSCYKGGDVHCGKCGTCVERLEAIHEAVARAHPDFDEGGIEDEARRADGTIYNDIEFWKTVTREQN